MRVVAGGSRYQEDEEFVFRVMDALHKKLHITRIAHGDCRGTDKLIGKWADSRGIECEPYPVTDEEWRRIGKAAGPLRNNRMIEQEQPQVVIGLPGGSGTAGLLKLARAHRPPITTIVVGRKARGGKDTFE